MSLLKIAGAAALAAATLAPAAADAQYYGRGYHHYGHAYGRPYYHHYGYGYRARFYRPHYGYGYGYRRHFYGPRYGYGYGYGWRHRPWCRFHRCY